MVSNYVIKPEDRAFIDEFWATPVGHHSPNLQRILTVFRGEALEGKYLLLCVEPFRKWVLAQTTSKRGAPLTILGARVYQSRSDAERDVFKLRWKRYVGEELETDPTSYSLEESIELPEIRLCGYVDRLEARPGDTIRFMVSSLAETDYRADIVRLICGDANPKGPGFKETLIETSVNGSYRGRHQPIDAGSYLLVPDCPALRALDSFSVQAAIWPTTPLKGPQGLIGWWSESESSGFALSIDEQGALSLEVGSGRRQVARISAGQPLRSRQWYLVGASYDAAAGTVRLLQDALNATSATHSPTVIERTIGSHLLGRHDAPLVMAGSLRAEGKGRISVLQCYNGKIDSPRLLSRALEVCEMQRLLTNPRPEEEPDAVGAWDFSRDIMSIKAMDRSVNLMHGSLVNLPTRAVTGWNWAGEVMDWKSDPNQWGAIHFHDDDLYDAGWQPDFSLTIPDGMESGIYAARLRSGTSEDYVPFVVAPRPGKERRMALLLPTATYMAYANEHIAVDYEDTELGCGKLSVLYPADRFLSSHREYGLSLYDTHSDGSGVCYSSRLRPMLNMRPKYEGVYGAFGGSQVWGFNADTHITDWLEAMGHPFDVITDEELHQRGLDILEPYRVIVTGTHPEYHSLSMLEAIRAYTRNGGRLMYLGGNGFYWRTAFHSELPGVIEVRRPENGVRAWASAPGEAYNSFDGAYGGTWRAQGRAPNTLVGVGFCAQGGDICTYFRRRQESFDPKVAFIFEGVGANDLIGDFGLVGGGAAGLEIDCVSAELGAPPGARHLASSENHTDNYFVTLEETLQPGPGRGGQEHPKVRSDIVFTETGNGGAVFSVSSIAWAGSLPHANYHNNVSQITDNVIRRFLDPTPF